MRIILLALWAVSAMGQGPMLPGPQIGAAGAAGIVTNGLTAFYRSDSTSGWVLTDSTPGGGSNSGCLGDSAAGACVANVYAPRVLSGVLQFDGVQSFATLPAITFDNAAFTVQIFYQPVTTGSGVLLSRGGANSGGFAIFGNGELGVKSSTGVDVYDRLCGSTVAPGAITDLAFTGLYSTTDNSQNAFNCYLSGVLSNGSVATNAAHAATATCCAGMLGARSTSSGTRSNQYQGGIYFVLIYSRALSASELLQNHNVLMPAAPPTVLYTHYVDTTNGNDGNAGTVGSPWKTLVYAESTATAGDTILIKPGTYTEDWNPAKGIAWTGDITGGDGTGKVIVKPSSAVAIIVTGNSTWSATAIEFQPNSKTYALEFDSSANGSKTCSRCRFIGNPTTVSVEIQGNGAYAFTDCVISTTSGVTAQVRGATSGKTGTVTLTRINAYTTSTASSAQILFTTASYAVDIESAQLLVSSTSQSRESILLTDQPTSTVNASVIDTQVGGSGLTAAAIHINSTGTDVVASMTNDTLLVRNANAHYGGHIGDDNGSSGNLHINAATITGNTIKGPRFFSPSTSSVATHGIIVAWNINAGVTDNLVIGTGYCIILKGAGGVSYTWTAGGVFYNVCWDMGTAVNRGWLYAKGVQNTRWYNNTVYAGLTDSPVSNNNANLAENNINTDSPGTTDGPNNGQDYRNNILAGIDVGNAFFYKDISTLGALDYNLYYASGTFGGGSGGGGFASLDGTTYVANFAALQGAGYEAHGVNANPLFTSAATGDFTIPSNSPAYQTGLYIPGVSRTNPPNIGAR